jgi:nucleotide-binding universal stress UspA family protein
MAETYLVGVDGSDGSRRALHFAACQAHAASARLLVAHVIDQSPDSLAPTAPEAQAGRREAALDRATRALLEPLAADARGLGVAAVETLCRHGHPASELAAIAAERGASQIFVGRHGHSRVHEILFGSVLLSLAHKAAVPVTLVP